MAAESPPRIRPLVDETLRQQGAENPGRREAARALAAAIFQHAGDARRRTYVEYAVWRLLAPPEPRE
jgi:hypothetical protein